MTKKIFYIIKKRKIRKIIINSKTISNIGSLLRLLNNDSLENYIINLNGIKVKLNIHTENKRKYLTSNEQFLSMLDSFISFYQNYFYFSKNQDIFLPLILKSKCSDFLLCKHYRGDNNYINYFYKNYKILIINNFHQNLKQLKKYSNFEIKEIKDIINLDFLEKNDDIDRLFNYLKYLCIANKNKINISYLFENINDYLNLPIYKNNKNSFNSIYNMYEYQYRDIMLNYNKNSNEIKALRKFF